MPVSSPTMLLSVSTPSPAPDQSKRQSSFWLESTLGLPPSETFSAKNNPVEIKVRSTTPSFREVFLLSHNQLVGGVRHVSEYWHPKERQADTEGSSVDFCKQFVVNMSRRATHVAYLLSLCTSVLAIDASWLSTVVSKNLIDIFHSYVAEPAEQAKPFHLLGSNSSWISLPSTINYYFIV